LDADILLIDEALAVGDIFFRQKCYQRLEELRKRGVSIILVTHSMGDVEQFCERAVLLDHGKELFQGAAPAAVKRYYLLEQQEHLAHGNPSFHKMISLQGLNSLYWIKAKFSGPRLKRFLIIPMFPRFPTDGPVVQVWHYVTNAVSLAEYLSRGKQQASSMNSNCPVILKSQSVDYRSKMTKEW
jgi:ABC-type multidrug transport system ATPase subunit